MSPASSPAQAAVTASEAGTRTLVEKAREHLGSDNLWGTAFPQWYDLDMYYRFTVTVRPGEQG